MKKAIFLAIIFFTPNIFLKAQNAFYDAKKIALLITSPPSDAIMKDAISRSLSYFVNPDGKINSVDYFRMMDKKVTEKIYGTLDKNSVESICKMCVASFNNSPAQATLKDLIDYCKKSARFDSLSKVYQKNIIPFDSTLNELNKILKNLQSELLNKIKDSLFIEAAKKNQKQDSITNEEINKRKQALEIRSIELVRNDTAAINLNIFQTTENKNEEKENYDSSIAMKKATDLKVLKEYEHLVANNDAALSAILLKQYNSSKVQFTKTQSYFNTLENSTTLQNQSQNFAGSGNETTTLTNFKMPSQTEMIDALAIYIARRFKQEMALTLVEELRKSFNKQPLLKELFPETIKLFNNNDVYELPRFGKIWNHSISEDFVKLPDNIKASSYLKMQSEKTHCEKDFAIFKDLVTISNWVIEKNALPEIVQLYRNDTTTIESAPIQETMQVMNIVNNELFDNSTSGLYWIGWKQLEQMSPIEFEIFLNLLEIKYSSVFKSLAIKNPSTWGKDSAVNTIKVKNYLTKILLTVNNFQSAQRQYLKRLETDASVPYTGMSFWDFEKNLLSILLNKSFINFPEKSEQMLSLLDRSTGLYKLLEEKNYAAMVHESMSILEDLIPVETNRFNEFMIKSWKLDKTKYRNISPVFLQKTEILRDKFSNDINLMHKEYVASNYKDYFLKNFHQTETYKYYHQLSQDKNYRRLLVIKSDNDFANAVIYFAKDSARLNLLAQPSYSKSRFLYVTKTAEFLTDVMSAENSKQLASVMDAYGMPPNSYKIKRSSRFTVELNAYVGAFGGFEFIAKKNNASNTKTTDASPVYGISVPVGLSVSWGSHSTAKNSSSSLYLNKRGTLKDLSGNSFSLSLTIIDITAVVTYRLEKGENEALPKEIKWSQVLSPGLHGRWGIRNTPLCLSTGIQYTPQLRNLNDALASQQAWRVYAGLFFDIPLYNLYRR